jgi:hypothetical protein
METRTEFNLNTAIQRWRNDLGQSPSIRAENLDELETHLRDSVTAFRKAALSEEEAFLIAARRLGGAPALEREFAKVNGREVWLNRLLWMLVGAQLWPLVSGSAGNVARATVVGGLRGLGYEFKSTDLSGLALPAALTLGANLLILGGCVAACWWALRRQGGVVARGAVSLLKRPLFVPVLVGLIPSLLLGCVGLVRYALLARQLPSATFGAIVTTMAYANVVFVPIVATCLLVLTVVLARRQLRLSTRS